ANTLLALRPSGNGISDNPRNGRTRSPEDRASKQVLDAQLRVGDRGEATRVETERRAIAVLEVDDLAQEQRVIASVVVPPGSAFEVRQNAGQPRNPCTVNPHRRALSRTCELSRDRLLLGAEDIDAERAALQNI